MHAIEEHGREEYGADALDAAVNHFVGKLGQEKTVQIMALAREFDAPHRLIMELDD